MHFPRLHLRKCSASTTDRRGPDLRFPDSNKAAVVLRSSNPVQKDGLCCPHGLANSALTSNDPRQGMCIAFEERSTRRRRPTPAASGGAYRPPRHPAIAQRPSRAGWPGRPGERRPMIALTVTSLVPSHPHLAPTIAPDVHKRPADSLRRHLASPPVPPHPARPGVGWSESGAKSAHLRPEFRTYVAGNIGGRVN